MFDSEMGVRIGRFVFSDIDLYLPDEFGGELWQLNYSVENLINVCSESQFVTARYGLARYGLGNLDLIQLTPDLIRVYYVSDIPEFERHLICDYNKTDFPEWAQSEMYECESGATFPASFLAKLCYEIENCCLFA